MNTGKTIAAGKDCITEIPEERWDPDLYYDPRPDTEAGIIAGMAVL